MGTSLPSAAGEFLDDGAVDKIFLWDPLIAGQAQDKLALMLIKGGEDCRRSRSWPARLHELEKNSRDTARPRRLRLDRDR